MVDYKLIGARIRQARQIKHLTQVELAVAIGVSRAHLTNAEGGNGGLALDKLILVAAETGTTVGWLIGESGPVDPLEAELLTVFRAIVRRDRESLVRIAHTFPRDKPHPEPPSKPKGRDRLPFPEGGNVRRKRPISAQCMDCVGSDTLMAV